MKKYTISVPIKGRIEVTVEAGNIHEAIDLAEQKAVEMIEDCMSIDPERDSYDIDKE